MEDTKHCPYCDEIIRANAIKCKHCGSLLTSGETFLGEYTPENEIKLALSGKYELLEEIGRGGMATVYKAVQKNLGRLVALKVIHKNLVGYKEFLERFTREAQLSASLNHHNIVTVYDVGLESGINYISMEFLDGSDLHSLIQKKGRLSIEESVNIIAPIAEALGYAHKKGIIHRDIKSSNIIITSSGKPVLTDFGIAHAATASKLTQSGMIMGTPDYMSPEQAISGIVDAQSDLYSLGIVLYECLTGILPFRGDTPVSTIYKIVHDEVTPIREKVIDAPKWIESVIKKVLAKNKNQRFKNGEEFSRALSAKKEQTMEFSVGPNDETIRISSDDLEKLNQKYHPFRYLKNSTFMATSSVLLIGIISFILYIFDLPPFNSSEFKGGNWDSLADLEKQKVEIFIKEGNELFNSHNLITPPDKNAAENYTSALKINTGNKFLEDRLNIISEKITDSIDKLITINELDKAKPLLEVSQQYFSKSNIFSVQLPKRIKIKELEIKVAQLRNNDPSEALNISKNILEIDPQNAYASSVINETKNNLKKQADIYYEQGKLTSALNSYKEIKAIFPNDTYADQMIESINKKLQEENVLKAPNLVGLTLNSAKSKISRFGLTAGKISEIISVENNKGKVIAQIPRAGAVLSKGEEINLIIGK